MKEEIKRERERDRERKREKRRERVHSEAVELAGEGIWAQN